MGRFGWIIVCLAMLAGCARIDILNASTPRFGYRIYENMAYGPHPRQTLDIYVPEDITQPAPVVVFFYGGSWQRGEKENYKFVAQALVSQGYVAVIANYRLYPEVKFPTFIEDAAHAVRFAHDHAAAYGGDTNNLYLAGHSAGAYNAVMLSLDPRYLRQAGASRRWIRGTMALSGPYDFLPYSDPAITDIFSTGSTAITQPVNRVQKLGPALLPFFLASGDSDDLVLPHNTERLAAVLKKAGIAPEVHIYTDTNHSGIALALAEGFRHRAPVLADMARFIERTRR